MWRARDRNSGRPTSAINQHPLADHQQIKEHVDRAQMLLTGPAGPVKCNRNLQDISSRSC
jgi:hypothetical protein